MAQVNRPATAFSLDPSRKAQGGRIEDRKHLAFIRRLPCLVTGLRSPIDAAHIRYGDPAHGKPKTPLGRKPDDCWVVPLNHDIHMDQHASGERVWWERVGIDPVAVAARLYAVSGDLDAALAVLADFPGAAPWAGGFRALR